jgi:D-arabinose 1-dehydrogenase-like Zn-dependent alcohol dehydrogenase
VPIGPPAAGQLTVAVQFAGLNRIDRLLADGLVPRLAGQHVLGGQGAGRVTAIGEGIQSVAVGDTVALYPYGGCGECAACASGNETLCRNARLDGVNSPGCCQSHFTAAARDAFLVPTPVTAEAAVLAPTLAVAWHVLVCRGQLQAGETVAISSISSGLGVCCGALADHLGATVIGLARQTTLERVDRLPSWLQQTVATDGDGRPPRVDLAVDAVGAPTLPFVHRTLRTGGRLVTVGAHAGREVTLDLWRLFTREQDIRGSHGCHRPDMTSALEALRGLDAGSMIDSIFEISEFAAAYRRLDTRGRFGNVLLRFEAPEAAPGVRS